MKNIIFIYVLILCPIYSQGQHNLNLSIGQGFEDGLLHYPTPTIGIGYERELNKYFSAYTRLHTFYRRDRDVESLSVRGPSIGSIEPASQSQFITQDDIEKYRNLGLKDIGNLKTFKALSIPWVLGVKFTPLRYKNNSLNLYAGLLIMYESRNALVEFFAGQADITLSDGEMISSEFTLISEIYFRHIVAAESLGIGYEYQFENLGLEIYFGENSVFGPAASSSVWDLSLRIKLKI
jgi:hypothetical protein